MTSRTFTLVAAALMLGLSACNNEPSSDSKTTRLDAIEVEPGSISDAMITLDQVASDGTAIDHNTPADSSKKAATKADESSDTASSDSSSNSGGLTTAPGDVVVTPSGPASASN